MNRKLYTAVAAIILSTTSNLSFAENTNNYCSSYQKYSISDKNCNKEKQNNYYTSKIDTSFNSLYLDENLWSRIRDGFSMVKDSNSINYEAKIILGTKNQKKLFDSKNLAEKYLYHVVEEIDKRNMPMEVALIPFIESSFNPNATSPVNASGLWQIMPGTGKRMNLEQNQYKDERRDIVASTDAALNYIESLYEMFGDWKIALSAYNWGEGSMQKAINANKKDGRKSDYESLVKSMPAETRDFVPKLMHIKNIVQNPEKYNVELPDFSNTPYFASIKKPKDMNIEFAAKMAEISVDEFKLLNPQFRKSVVTGGNDTKILLPINSIDRFKINLSSWTSEFGDWTHHRVSDTKTKLIQIAKMFKTTPENLRLANNIPFGSDVSSGKTILVPRLSANIDGVFSGVPVASSKIISIDNIAVDDTIGIEDDRKFKQIRNRYHKRTEFKN